MIIDFGQTLFTPSFGLVYNDSMAKKITLEILAQMVQRGFEEIRGEMATKNDIAMIREEMITKEDLKLFRLETKEDLEYLKRELTTEISRSAAHTSKEMSRLRDWIKDIDERLMDLEAKQVKRK